MKVLLLNGSPHADGSVYTALAELISVLNSEGIDTELVHVGSKAIRGCIACRRCSELGKCVFEDEVNEIAKKFEESLKYLIELGEVEKTIYLLAEEIEATKRRVNALEHIMIPRFQNTEKYIDMRLQEMERENFVRLKMIRSTIEKNEKAAAAAEAAKNAEA